MSPLARLTAVLEDIGEAAIAVSGGVDSMTLAYAAHAESRGRATMFHAVSPAVPAHATDRVRAHAARHGWDLHIVGANEFADPDYLANPINRCFFCKSNLYDRLRAATEATICSGTNTDDLGDFRPGLQAAAERQVRHPFVEAGIDKPAIRALAGRFGLDDIAELPAQPCLASRVETGLRIVPEQLALIDEIERMIAAAIGPGDIRCRMTRAGVRIEVPEPALSAVDAGLRADVEARVGAAGSRLVAIAPYRRGSAFVHPPA